MAILDWFKKKEPEDYEQVLASLAVDIQKRQARLSEIRLRERRTTLAITLYTLAAWAAYVAAWYIGWRPLKAIPIFAGPIIIQFSRRIAQTWYTRIGNAEEKTLKDLLSQQRSKVEEIKKKTNYYSMKNLVERYDSPSGPGTPARPRPGAPPQPQQQNQQQPPQRLGPGQPNGLSPNKGQGQPPNMPFLGPQVPRAPLEPPRKKWFDKLADALLGDDELGGPNAATSRYALICQKCFTHNGLVKQDQWEDTQYVCPKCGHFNPSMRALKSGHARSPSGGSPTSQSQLQRKAPRLSAPITSAGPLYLEADSGADRRRSLPTPDMRALQDEDEGHPAGVEKSSPIHESLVEDDERGNGEESSDEEVLRRRQLRVTIAA